MLVKSSAHRKLDLTFKANTRVNVIEPKYAAVNGSRGVERR
jgi:hypothetical protein